MVGLTTAGLAIGAPVEAASAQAGASSATPNGTAIPAPNSTATNGDKPTTATQVRITPIQFEEGYLGVTVRESDAVFETQGPFVLFSLSDSVESARVQQQPASATVLEGGHQVKVEYADDAAPTGEESRYVLELFFADGSSKTVELYARQTAVSVGAADLQEYEPVIEQLQHLADDHGYGSSPEELQAYLEYINNRADLVEGFLTEKAAQLIAVGIQAATNWLFWLLFLGAIALLAKWLQRRFGGLLEALQNDVGRADRKRRELELAYQEQKQTADEVPLDEIPAIGTNATYWIDGLGTRSAGQLARLAAYGAHRRNEDGLEQVHRGVADLDVEDIQNSWIEPVIRGNRIPTAKQALGELKSTLEYMETQHNLGHLYRDARDDLEQLIEEIEDEQHLAYGPNGGDD